MSRRKNAGQGYGFDFHGAFTEKEDAVRKEKKTPGSFIKGMPTKHGYRWIVMSPRTNPRKPSRRRRQTTPFLMRNPNLVEIIRPGDRVTIVNRFGQQSAGRAVMRSSSGGWVLNMGGAHGTPGIANEENIVKVKPRRNPGEKAISLKEFRKMLQRAGYGPGAAVRGVTREQAEAYIRRLDEIHSKYSDPHRTIEGPLFGNNPATKIHKHFAPHTGTYSSAADRAYKYADEMRAKFPGRKVEILERSSGAWDVYVLNEPAKNPGELIVLGANPHNNREIELPAGSTLTIRTNPSLELNPAEICGYNIDGYPCSRKPHHKGPHLPQGATLRPRSRVPNNWVGRRRNPSAATIREDFVGKASDGSFVQDAPGIPAGDYAQLGELLALYVKPVIGGQVQQLDFRKGERPLLLCDESRRQLYFLDGDQDLTDSIGIFGVHQFVAGDGPIVLGECRRIDYKQRKEHAEAPDVDEWRHDFGEETGERPALLFDPRIKRMFLRGGAYEVRREGIVN